MAKANREKFAPYDSADYLRTEKDVASYLKACMKEAGDDPAFIVQALGTVANAKGMSGLAKMTGLTREGLYKALSKGGNPGFGTVFRVIRAMGLRIELAR